MDKQKASLDEVLEKFGIFGRYHIKLMVYIALAYASNSLYASNYIFTVEKSGYRCLDEGFENNTCKMNSTSCSEFIYDNPHSFVAEIACQEWKRTLVGTIHSLGYMVGLLIVGPLSDRPLMNVFLQRIGRKKTLVLTGVMGGIFGLARSFTYSYWLYIVLEFMEAAIGDICSPAYVLNLEVVAANKRVMYHVLCATGYIVGAILFPFAAWGVPYWRNFLRVLYAPALLFFFYVFLIDESPRWLLTRGKREKAVAIVEKMADQNRVKVDRDVLDKLLIEVEAKSIGFIKLLKMTFTSRALLKRCMICIVWWTTSTFVNYGIMINSVSLQGNKYLNYALVSAIELPGNFVIMYIMINFKRRNPLIASFLVGSVLCFIQPFLPRDLPWLSILIYMASKLMSSFYFSITYMYTSELFPTYTRNSMHALCSSLGRIGSIVAPQTPLLMVYWSGLPSVIFGGASLIAGLVTFLVPDTANNALPDTVRQAEAIGAKQQKQGIDNIAMSKESINGDLGGSERVDT